METFFTLVELDCRDIFDRPHTVRLLVWLFGVRKVLDDEEPGPPPPVPAELLPRSIPYNPSVRAIVFYFVFAILFAIGVQFLQWPRLVQIVVSGLWLLLPILLLMRRFIWPREIMISESSITIWGGFLSLRSVNLPYSDITFVNVACLPGSLMICISTSDRVHHIQDLFLPDWDTFNLLRFHLGTFVHIPTWDETT